MSRDRPSARVLTDLAASPTWMYEWELRDGTRTGLLHHELTSIHETRAATAEPVVREALAAAGPSASAIDLACSEGWFSHRLLEWGAESVIGVDVRPENIHRARLIREHFGIPSSRLEFREADIFDLGGAYDVVLCLGLIYHLENPVGALRVARRLTRGVCVIESQLTEQRDPIRHGWGVTGQFEQQPASWAAVYEPRQEEHPIASHGGVVSFVPNRTALMDAARGWVHADRTACSVGRQ
jgi:tRNA (mo5U34)-methyltransferase